MKKVVLFGASKMGEIAYERLKYRYDIICFTDNDKAKWGKTLKGIKIIEPGKLIPLSEDSEIIIASRYDVSIAKQLIEMNIKRFGVLQLNFDDVKFYNYNMIKKSDKEKIALVMNNNSGSNTYALYKNIPEEINNKYEVSLVNLNERKSSYYLDLIRSKMIVRTHCEDFYYDNSQINIQLWHGFPLKGLCYMNKYTNQIVKDKKHKQWANTSAIASYSQTYSTLINACYGLKENKYEITGMPRNDLLLTSNGRQNLSNVLGIDIGNKKVILYMPTYRHSIYGEINGNAGEFNVFEVDKINEATLDDFLEKLGVIMIFKFHPLQIREAAKVIKEKKLKNIFVIEDNNLVENDLDFYEIVNAADILITDYSSIYFDYLLLDRPIVFTPLDFEEYEKNRGFLLEPLDFWLPGPKCKNFNELKMEIEKSLTDGEYYKKERKIIRDIVHRYKDANSSKRVWKLIENLMSDDIY